MKTELKEKNRFYYSAQNHKVVNDFEFGADMPLNNDVLPYIELEGSKIYFTQRVFADHKPLYEDSKLVYECEGLPNIKMPENNKDK